MRIWINVIFGFWVPQNTGNALKLLYKTSSRGSKPAIWKFTYNNKIWFDNILPMNCTSVQP